MTARCYSIRKFAEIAGTSPQTLSELIKKGTVRVNNAGQVPESEVDYFIRRKLKKGLEEGSGDSYLYITVGRTQEELAVLLQAHKEAAGDRLTEVASIEDLVEEVRKSLFRRNLDEMDTNLMWTQYKASILQELVKRCRSAAVRCISSCVDIPEVNRFSLVSLYELFMYDRLYTDRDREEELRSCLSKAAVHGGSSPLDTMEAAYQSIVVSLYIVADKASGRPLISRTDWNPDTIQAIRKMSGRKTISDNAFIKKMSSTLLLPDPKAGSRKEGLEALKIFRSVRAKNASKNGLFKAYQTGLQGYCTFFNVSEETTEQEVQTLISNIHQGYYRNIEIETPGGFLPENFPEMLRMALSICQKNNTAAVREMKLSGL